MSYPQPSAAVTAASNCPGGSPTIMSKLDQSTDLDLGSHPTTRVCSQATSRRTCGVRRPKQSWRRTCTPATTQARVGERTAGSASGSGPRIGCKLCWGVSTSCREAPTRLVLRDALCAECTSRVCNIVTGLPTGFNPSGARGARALDRGRTSQGVALKLVWVSCVLPTHWYLYLAHSHMSPVEATLMAEQTADEDRKP
jgi:hypothetical protein